MKTINQIYKEVEASLGKAVLKLEPLLLDDKFRFQSVRVLEQPLGEVNLDFYCAEIDRSTSLTLSSLFVKSDLSVEDFETVTCEQMQDLNFKVRMFIEDVRENARKSANYREYKTSGGRVSQAYLEAVVAAAGLEILIGPAVTKSPDFEDD